jgi:hypothetical protein
MLKAPELLLPAGTLDKMRAAYDFGADAVYAGQPRYSLRARNNDFKLEELKTGIDEAHARGKLFFVASNLLPHNSKIKTYMADMEPVIAMKPDALIMADPGLIMMVRERWPEVPVHLSVQANTVNYMGVKFWQKLGVSRIILSRELSLDEIAEIRQECPDIELEVFVHGALCIAYSGRCLLSGYFNHRDPNQGTCTNACRWDYKMHDTQGDDAGDVQTIKLDFNKALEEANQSLPPVVVPNAIRWPTRPTDRRGQPPGRADAHHRRRAWHLHHELQGPARGGAGGEAGEDRRGFAEDRRPYQEPVLRGAYRAGVSSAPSTTPWPAARLTWACWPSWKAWPIVATPWLPGASPDPGLPELPGWPFQGQAKPVCGRCAGSGCRWLGAG